MNFFSPENRFFSKSRHNSDAELAFLRLSAVVFRPFWRCWKKQLTKLYINFFQRVDLHCIDLATLQKITKNFLLEMFSRGLLNPARSEGKSIFSQYFAKSRCFSSILAMLELAVNKIVHYFFSESGSLIRQTSHSKKSIENFPLESFLRGLLNPTRNDGNSLFSQYSAKSRCFSSILAML